MKTSMRTLLGLTVLVVMPGMGAEPLSTAKFEELHALIKPHAGESRWMEVDWHPSVWEGRRLAAEQGKPLFLMAGSGGAPCAGC